MVIKGLEMGRNIFDLCLFYKWINDHFVMVLLWVEDFSIVTIVGPDKLIPGIQSKFLAINRFENTREMNEYVYFEVERN